MNGKLAKKLRHIAKDITGNTEVAYDGLRYPTGGVTVKHSDKTWKKPYKRT